MRSLLGVGSTPRYGLPSLKCTSPTSRFWQNQQRQFHRSPRFVIPALTLVPCTMKCNVLLSQIYLSFFPPSIVHSLATNPHKILYESTEKSSQNIVRFPTHLLTWLLKTRPKVLCQKLTIEPQIQSSERHTISLLISTSLLSHLHQDPTTTSVLLAQDLQVNSKEDLEPSSDLADHSEKSAPAQSGIHMALSLKDRGYSDVVIFERYYHNNPGL